MAAHLWPTLVGICRGAAWAVPHLQASCCVPPFCVAFFWGGGASVLPWFIPKYLSRAPLPCLAISRDDEALSRDVGEACTSGNFMYVGGLVRTSSQGTWPCCHNGCHSEAVFVELQVQFSGLHAILLRGSVPYALLWMCACAGRCSPA